jgi:hypothetical protein
MARVRIGLAGLLIVSLVGCGGSSSTSGSPAASVVAPATTAPSMVRPTVSATPSPSPTTGWRVVSTRSDLGPGRLKDVTTFRGSLIAVGATDAGLGVIWSSADGEVWRSIAGSTPLDGIVLQSVAAGDAGIVVVGWSDGGAVVLFSPDGVSWASEPLPGSHRGSSIESVAWRQGRFLAVGGGGEPFAVVSWRSEDGRVWKPVSIVAEGNQASLNSVAAGPSGFVADGMHGGHGVVWVSTAGETWSRVDLPITAADDPGRLRYAGGKFFLPVSGGGVWISTDGQHWSKTTVPRFGVGVFDIAAIPGGFVAVGRSSEGSEPGVVASADSNLTRWTLLPADPALDGVLAAAVLVSPNRAYLVGVGMSLSDESVFLLADPSSLVSP